MVSMNAKIVKGHVKIDDPDEQILTVDKWRIRGHRRFPWYVFGDNTLSVNTTSCVLFERAQSIAA